MLNLWLKQNAQLKNTVWSRQGNLGKMWRLGYSTIQSSDAYFELVFEGLEKIKNILYLNLKIKTLNLF